ncbi:hypothetical protein STHU_37660 [Allostella humosa]|uniref:GTPase domain-containing protein n=1 Tax=Stella humosa TaxID=94 RepID=UPI000F4BD715|nr:GTPase domain-containing protein [Stella humosa]BBK33132.1 hypothetical protein STHU_37660 [Stella humosa]
MPLPLIAWGAGAILVALGTGAYSYFYGRGARVADECRDRVRIWVVGPTGVGKTVLIGGALRRPPPAGRDGSPRTARLEWHWEGDGPLALADTVGLELVRGTRQVGDATARLAATALAERPHAAWICVRDDAARVFGADPAASDGTEAALARMLRSQGIPAIGVLTQADLGAEDGPMATAMRTAMPDLAALVAVCVLPRLAEDGGELVPRHGMDRLRSATLAVVDEAARARLERDWPAYGW